MSSSDLDDDGIPAIVIDNGSHTVKSGFAEDDGPRSLTMSFRSSGAVPSARASELHNYVFTDERFSPMKDIFNPIVGGVFQDWDCLEALWGDFFTEYSVSCADQPILMLSSISNNTENHIDKFNEIIFEKFGFPMLCLATPETMALTSVGRTTGVVTNVGYDSCLTVPIIDGHRVTDAAAYKPIKVGGRSISNIIREHLQEFQLDPPSLEVVVEDIKRNHCYVGGFGCEPDPSHKQYKLPDGREISLGKIEFESCEVLFKNSWHADGRCYQGHCGEVGIAEALCNTVLRTDGRYRHTFWSNMMVYGRSSLLQGLENRLYMEVVMRSDPGARFNMCAPVERAYSAWIGGSMFAALSPFNSSGLSKQEFEESGTRNMTIY